MKRLSLSLLLFALLAAGLTAYPVFTNSALTSTTAVQSTTTDLYGWYIYNPNASACSLDFFNATTSNVTLGTTVPKLSLVIPATSGANLIFPNSIAHFQTALSVAAVTAAGGSSTCSTGMTVNLFYQ
jgi:uncharacterized membrane protein YqgA involved in biofilm formation